MRRIATGAILRALLEATTEADMDRLTGAVTELARGLWHSMVPGGSALARTPAGGFRRFSAARAAVDDHVRADMAGRGTLTAALAWTWLLLAQNPSAAARIRAEADDALEGRGPSAKDLPQLAFTRKSFDEALRIYPPAWVLRRKVVQDRTLGGTRVP